jgi:hypothetical protein
VPLARSDAVLLVTTGGWRTVTCDARGCGDLHRDANACDWLARVVINAIGGLARPYPLHCTTVLAAHRRDGRDLVWKREFDKYETAFDYTASNKAHLHSGALTIAKLDTLCESQLDGKKEAACPTRRRLAAAGVGGAVLFFSRLALVTGCHVVGSVALALLCNELAGRAIDLTGADIDIDARATSETPGAIAVVFTAAATNIDPRVAADVHTFGDDLTRVRLYDRKGDRSTTLFSIDISSHQDACILSPALNARFFRDASGLRWEPRGEDIFVSREPSEQRAAISADVTAGRMTLYEHELLGAQARYKQPVGQQATAGARRQSRAARLQGVHPARRTAARAAPPRRSRPRATRPAVRLHAARVGVCCSCGASGRTGATPAGGALVVGGECRVVGADDARARSRP